MEVKIAANIDSGRHQMSMEGDVHNVKVTQAYVNQPEVLIQFNATETGMNTPLNINIVVPRLLFDALIKESNKFLITRKKGK